MLYRDGDRLVSGGPCQHFPIAVGCLACVEDAPLAKRHSGEQGCLMIALVRLY